MANQHEWVNFLWRGERIPDIRQWAAEHNQPMIKYKHTYHEPMGDSMFEGEMPKHFWDHMRTLGNETWEALETIPVKGGVHVSSDD